MRLRTTWAGGPRCPCPTRVASRTARQERGGGDQTPKKERNKSTHTECGKLSTQAQIPGTSRARKRPAAVNRDRLKEEQTLMKPKNHRRPYLLSVRGTGLVVSSQEASSEPISRWPRKQDDRASHTVFGRVKTSKQKVESVMGGGRENTKLLTVQNKNKNTIILSRRTSCGGFRLIQYVARLSLPPKRIPPSSLSTSSFLI